MSSTGPAAGEEFLVLPAGLVASGLFRLTCAHSLLHVTFKIRGEPPLELALGHGSQTHRHPTMVAPKPPVPTARLGSATAPNDLDAPERAFAGCAGTTAIAHPAAFRGTRLSTAIERMPLIRADAAQRKSIEFA